MLFVFVNLNLNLNILGMTFKFTIMFAMGELKISWLYT